MLYEVYEKRLKKLYSLKNKIYKHRIFLLIVAAIITLFSIAFTVSKGSIYDINFPDTLVYGEDFEVNANALFSSIEYEYSIYGNDEWTKEKPKTPGHYQVRLSSKKSFGSSNFEIFSFVIKPKAIAVTINENIIDFGSELTVKTDL